MNFRLTQYAAVCGLSLMTLPGAVVAQTPRYESPINAPAVQPKLNLPTTTPITPNGEVVEDVVVRVNDQIITRSDVERSEQQLNQELQQDHATPEEAADRQKNMLRDMIDQQLLLSRGKELGIDPDAEVIRRLDEIRKQNHLDSMEALEQAARQQGVSFEDFKASIRNQIITQQVVRDEVGRRIQIAPTQEQAYYEAHKQEFSRPEQIRLSEILVPTPADASDAIVAQAKAKAEDIESKLKGGAAFDEMAKTYSGGPTAAQGGDLGEFKRGGLAKVLEDQTFDLKAGEFTQPIRTRQGFVILKVTQHTEPGVPPLKEVEPQVQEAIYMQQMQPALRAYLTHLREDAYIDIKPGYVDSGASPNETKPVFSAYQPPVVKKKKAVEKKRFDRGGRFSTVAKTSRKKGAAPTGPQLAQMHGKKVKREKVRFGQAPRTTLPVDTAHAGLATDNGLGADHERVNTPTTQADAAPGTAIAPLDSTQNNVVQGNPFAPPPAPKKKTRFADRAREVKEEKVAKKTAERREKLAAAPAPMSQDEKEAAAVQSAPLGLNGDTATQKKKKRAKGAPKERLQNQKPTPKTLPPETPSRGADRGTPLEGTPAQGWKKPADTGNQQQAPSSNQQPDSSPSSSPQP